MPLMRAISSSALAPIVCMALLLACIEIIRQRMREALVLEGGIVAQEVLRRGADAVAEVDVLEPGREVIDPLPQRAYFVQLQLACGGALRSHSQPSALVTWDSLRPISRTGCVVAVAITHPLLLHGQDSLPESPAASTKLIRGIGSLDLS